MNTINSIGNAKLILREVSKAIVGKDEIMIKVLLAIIAGGIIGMGETWEDRIDMAVSLSELGVSSIPINALMPIPGTPFSELPQLTPEEILRTGAIFRFLNPEKYIRFAAGRGILPNGGEQAFHSGFNATITGDMLTTTGSSIRSDREMLSRMGFDIAQEVQS